MSKWHDKDMEIERLKRRIEELETALDKAMQARFDELKRPGPADIGMVPEGVKLRRGVPGQLWWREATHE